MKKRQDRHDAERAVRARLGEALRRKYGDEVPLAVLQRLDEECRRLGRHYESWDIIETAAEVGDVCRASGFAHDARGGVGNVYAACLLGISRCDPLPGGFDLDSALYLGIDGEERPQKIDINVPLEAMDSLRVHFRDRFTVPDCSEDAVVIDGCVNVLPSTLMSVILMLEHITGVPSDDADLEEAAVYDYLRTGDLSLLPFEADRFRTILAETAPQHFPDSFAGAVTLGGLALGSGDKGERYGSLYREGETLERQIACRDDIFRTFIEHGLEKREALALMKAIRTGEAGKVLSGENGRRLKALGIEDWYLAALKKILYIMPKAHVIGYMTLVMTLIWYKVHFPEVFDGAA